MSRYKINNLEEYFKEYKKSIREPRKFWGKIAAENFTWYQQWDKVFDFDMAEAIVTTPIVSPCLRYEGLINCRI